MLRVLIKLNKERYTKNRTLLMGIIFLIRYNNDRIYLKIWHTAKEGKTLRFGNSDMSGPSGF